MSRILETELQKQAIPCRVLQGTKFFERQEVFNLPFTRFRTSLSSHEQVKDLIAYLQVVDNPEYAPAFSRIINIPARGIGDRVSPTPLPNGFDSDTKFAFDM